MAANGNGTPRYEALDEELDKTRTKRRRAETLAEKHAGEARLLRAREESIMAEMLDLVRGPEREDE